MSDAASGGTPVGSVAEDYVKAIYAHTEWQPDSITTSGLATRLGLAASSVTEMVKKLSAAGLVNHIPYGAVTLTAAGTTLALTMVRRHRLIETWLVEMHGYGWDEVHDEAEVLEHALSERLLTSIDVELGHPRRDPHGDPIPTAEHVIAPNTASVLVGVPDGVQGAVARISDRDPALLRYLADAGIRIDSTLTVMGRTPFGGDLMVEVDGSPITLGADAASAIWLSEAVSVDSAR